MEETRATKEDHYLAQIAAEVRRSVAPSKSAKRIRLTDFILQFKTEKSDRARRSKESWAAALKIQLPKR